MNFKNLIIATHNKGKVREINDLLAPFGVSVKSALDMELPEPEETEKTFIGNALLKARAAASVSGMTALADDSGLEVFSLGGEPGIYSARWAERPDTGERDFAYAMDKVKNRLEALKTSDYSARFVCVLALVAPDGNEQVFEGEVRGRLVFPPRGENGFGYDPIFIADGQNITFGEMDAGEKHKMSHRADAFKKLVNTVFKS
jgi:XTP/dITP diphosphohydrolase